MRQKSATLVSLTFSTSLLLSAKFRQQFQMVAISNVIKILKYLTHNRLFMKGAKKKEMLQLKIPNEFYSITAIQMFFEISIIFTQNHTLDHIYPSHSYVHLLSQLPGNYIFYNFKIFQPNQRIKKLGWVVPIYFYFVIVQLSHIFSSFICTQK